MAHINVGWWIAFFQHETPPFRLSGVHSRSHYFQGHLQVAINKRTSTVQDHTVQSIPCPGSTLTILMQGPGPLQTFDRRLMRIYVWLYCVLGIFVPLALLAVGNCGLVRAVKRSTNLRRRFHVRHSHTDVNERVTTVLATVGLQGHPRTPEDTQVHILYFGTI